LPDFDGIEQVPAGSIAARRSSTARVNI